MSEPIVDDAMLAEWVGRAETVDDVITPEPVRRMCATFDRSSDWVENGAPLPLNWHWMYCVHAERAGRLGRVEPGQRIVVVEKIPGDAVGFGGAAGSASGLGQRGGFIAQRPAG